MVNASPLIALLRIGQEGLLPGLFSEVSVPLAAYREIRHGAAKDPNVARLATLQWLRRVSVAAIPDSVLGWALGPGESEVLAYAATAGRQAVLDDLAARRCARFLGVRVIGTGRVLVLARRLGLIASITDPIERLQQAGFRMSDRLIATLPRPARGPEPLLPWCGTPFR